MGCTGFFCNPVLKIDSFYLSKHCCYFSLHTKALLTCSGTRPRTDITLTMISFLAGGGAIEMQIPKTEKWKATRRQLGSYSWMRLVTLRRCRAATPQHWILQRLQTAAWQLWPGNRASHWVITSRADPAGSGPLGSTNRKGGLTGLREPRVTSHTCALSHTLSEGL